MGSLQSKNQSQKHQISFDKAVTVFTDIEGLDWEDKDHSSDEPRRKRLGRSASGRVLLVVYTVRGLIDEEENVRIISAR